MSSLKNLKTQIKEFLKEGAPEVMTISGDWGSGKTFAWNKYFEENKESKNIKLEQYSYISLFSTHSIDELKFSIFQNNVKINGNENLNKVKTFGKKLTSLAPDGVQYFNLGDLATRAISFLSVKETIICFDDFERMNSNLAPEEVLGLISELKEEKKCKIILIMNDNELSEEQDKSYKTYREKVVDKHFQFTPTPTECVEIIFDKESKDKEILIKKCEILKINNIRIIQKIAKLKEKLNSLLTNCEAETNEVVLSSLILFTYAFYTKHRFSTSYSLDDNRDNYSILTDYGHRDTTELDLKIDDFIRQGYLTDKDTIKELINQHDKEIKNNKQYKSTYDPLLVAQDMFYSNFADNQKDVINQVYQTTKNHIQHILTKDLHMSLNILETLECGEQVDELIELFVPTEHNISNIHSILTNKKLKNKIIEKYPVNKIKNQKPLKEILNDIVENPNATMLQYDEVKILNSIEKDDYKKLFKQTEHTQEWMDKVLQMLLQKDLIGTSDEQKKLTQTVRDVLTEIAEEEKNNNTGDIINQKRVESYLNNR